MNQKIKDLMTSMPHTIGAGATSDKALAMMREFNCHHLPVLDGGQLVGVLSDRDLVGLRENGVAIEDLMMTEPVVVSPEDNLKSVLEEMYSKRIHSVIVKAEGDNPWGIFTTTDLIKLFIDRNR